VGAFGIRGLRRSGWGRFGDEGVMGWELGR
jgi:hypothetical protein